MEGKDEENKEPQKNERIQRSNGMEWNGNITYRKKKVAREQRRSAVGPCIHNILDDDGLNPHATNWDF